VSIALSRSIILNGKFLAGPATGVQRVAAEMIRALDAIKRDQTFGAPDLELIMPPSVNVAPLDLSTIPISKIGFFKGIPWEQLDLPRLAEGRLIVNLANLGPILASNAVTMIHDAQTFSYPASYSRGFRAWYGLIQPILGRRNRRILTVSQFSKQQLVRYGIAAEEKIDVIHNGVDHIERIRGDDNAATHFNLRPKEFILGLANSQAHKNLSVLLKAFYDAKLRELDLVLFGHAKVEDIEKIIGRTLPANVKVIGPIKDALLKGLMESALCLAFPSRTEGFGLPPLEAMFVGCPAVVAPCGALPEICGEAAIYADPDDPQDWAEHILNLACDSTYWAHKRQVGKLHAGRFRWQTSATQLLNIIAPFR
jgi:glycosyltransferase involved in cell wall biosynthesis